jgi:hypothetical protein
MRSLLGRFHRPFARGVDEQLLLLNNLGDGSTLSLNFTTGVLDPRLTFTRASGGTYVGNDGFVYGVDFATSSSLAIGTGSKSVTLTATAGASRRYEIGQTVYIANGANNMSGAVTAYNASTQVLTINATSTSGSGSFTSWIVGNASARFDYDPSTLQPRGLLIEGSASNLFYWSESFETSGAANNWNFSALNTTRGTVTTTNPAGISTTVVKIQETSAAGLHAPLIVYSSLTSSVYTISAFVKAAERQYIQILDNGGTGAFGMFNLSGSGSVVSESAAGVSTITKYPDNWYRIVVRTPTLTNINVQFRLSTDGTTTSYTGTTGSGVYIWGAQLETGSGASSYIPTGASTGSRAADSCYLTDFAGWSAGGNFSTTEGTLFVDQAVTFVGTANYPIGGFSTSNTAGSRFGWQYRQGDSPQGYRGLVNAGYVYELPIGAGWSIPAGTTRFRHAMSCGGGTSAFLRQSLKSSASSGAPTQNNYSDTSTLNISGVAAFTLTQSIFTASVRIARVKYWPRAFTLAELDALTN